MPTQLTDSSSGNYLVNKEYVDSVAEGLHILEPCLVASYSNYVPTSSGYTHGSNNGVGATLEIDLSTGQTGNGIGTFTASTTDSVTNSNEVTLSSFPSAISGAGSMN